MDYYIAGIKYYPEQDCEENFDILGAMAKLVHFNVRSYSKKERDEFDVHFLFPCPNVCFAEGFVSRALEKSFVHKVSLEKIAESQVEE
jgi:hypothetical protein